MVVTQTHLVGIPWFLSWDGLYPHFMWESFALNGWCFKRLFHLSFKKSLFSLSFLSTFGPSLFDLRERERGREGERLVVGLEKMTCKNWDTYEENPRIVLNYIYIYPFNVWNFLLSKIKKSNIHYSKKKYITFLLEFLYQARIIESDPCPRTLFFFFTKYIDEGVQDLNRVQGKRGREYLVNT
jgi:hypothetical protein